MKMTINRQKVDLALARKNWTVSELAREYGTSRNRLYVILGGGTVLPKTAGKLAKALEVDITEIIESEV